MVFEKVKNNLEARGYRVSCFETAKEAADYLDAAIDGKSVGFGGSVTLDQLELYTRLSVHNLTYSHWTPEPPEAQAQIIKNAQDAQIYLSSANGLAETGEIINIDGRCNRISSIMFGHEKVYLVIGVNKLAPDYESALYRARNVAAPKNAQRLNRNTPCAVRADRCYDCSSPERICRGLFVLWEKPFGMEMEIVLVNEKLGF